MMLNIIPIELVLEIKNMIDIQEWFNFIYNTRKDINYMFSNVCMIDNKKVTTIECKIPIIVEAYDMQIKQITKTKNKLSKYEYTIRSQNINNKYKLKIQRYKKKKTIDKYINHVQMLYDDNKDEEVKNKKQEKKDDYDFFDWIDFERIQYEQHDYEYLRYRCYDLDEISIQL